MSAWSYQVRVWFISVSFVSYVYKLWYIQWTYNITILKTLMLLIASSKANVTGQIVSNMDRLLISIRIFIIKFLKPKRTILWFGFHSVWWNLGLILVGIWLDGHIKYSLNYKFIFLLHNLIQNSIFQFVSVRIFWLPYVKVTHSNKLLNH